jgi:hypothetical protein
MRTPTLPNGAAITTLLIALAAAPCAAAAQEADIALVYRLMLDGEMVVIPATGSERRAHLGDRLRSRDLVATSPTTRAALRFTSDGSLLRVNPGSQLRIRSEREGGSLMRTLELEFGEVWARVHRSEGSGFHVQTPSGVAAVKGTEFLVRVDPEGRTTVLTLEGIVTFFNAGGSVDVTAGRRVSVASSDEPPVAEPATAEELREVSENASDAPVTGGATTTVELRMEDDTGRVRTLILELPREPVRALVDGGPGR